MCYSPECLPQDLSGVLAFTEAIYGTDMCEVVPEERPHSLCSVALETVMSGNSEKHTELSHTGLPAGFVRLPCQPSYT